MLGRSGWDARVNMCTPPTPALAHSGNWRVETVREMLYRGPPLYGLRGVPGVVKEERWGPVGLVWLFIGGAEWGGVGCPGGGGGSGPPRGG